MRFRHRKNTSLCLTVSDFLYLILSSTCEYDRKPLLHDVNQHHFKSIYYKQHIYLDNTF